MSGQWGPGMVGADEQEGLVATFADAMAIQGLAVARQTLADDPALQCRVEAVVLTEL